MQRTHTRIIAAHEIASFEYCPLVWWHEQFEPWVHAENEELFARLVELEHEQGAAATALPEYRLIEQLLVRRGAFDKEQAPSQEDEEEVEESDEGLAHQQNVQAATRVYTLIMVVLGVVGLLCLGGSLLWH